MTQEDKHLLLVDLCSRLPYEVKLLHIPSGETTVLEMMNCDAIDGDIHDMINNFQPYLRPMESMTEEEKKEIKPLFSKFTDEFGKRVLVVRQNKMTLYQDWLNAHHFDYRGLIGRGLALEAPNGMYK